MLLGQRLLRPFLGDEVGHALEDDQLLEDVTGLLLHLAVTVSMVQSFMRRTAAVVWVQIFLASLLDSSLKPAEPNRVSAANYSLYFQTNWEFRRNLCQSLAKDAASVVQ